MPAGKTRDFPLPGAHVKCRTCTIGLLCLSGRRRFMGAYWCDTCKGAYYPVLKTLIRCVVFRSKRGTYRQRQPYCDACARMDMHIHDSVHVTLGGGNNNILVGITHRDAEAWRQGEEHGR